jgi:hypothetical protein
MSFGEFAPLSVHRGKKHDYLGIHLDFSTPKNVQIFMMGFIEPNPAANHLFTVNKTPPTLLPTA